ncbi:hypothetical protein K3495_g5074 [Podosphaera aphanis]|nr:hypothetical protein K3495_g5074 [Podosphaera aphanis]
MQETVINLTFTSGDLSHLAQSCSPREDWSIRNDHIPIEIRLGPFNVPRTESKRYAYQKAVLDKMKSVLRDSGWAQVQEPLVALQDSLKMALSLHCPRTRQSPYTKAAWSDQALITGENHGEYRAKSLRQELKNKVRRLQRSSWRKFVARTSGPVGGLHNKGLWKITRWTKRRANTQQGPPHLPPMRRTPQETPTNHTNEKADMLREKLFPTSVLADLSDLSGNWPPKRELDTNPEVTPDEIEEALKRLPRGKVPGPDEIPNEILQLLLPDWKVELARSITKVLQLGQIPQSFKESITIALRKDKRPDYSVPSSYRPIALENSLAKLIERIVADRLIAIAEEHGMLPRVQMGKRKD